MVEQVKLLRERFWGFDPNFNIQKFLEGCFSYLSSKSFNGVTFSYMLENECRFNNLNPRVVLVMLDLSYDCLGLREQPPIDMERKCFRKLDFGVGLFNQVSGMVDFLVRCKNQAKASSERFILDSNGNGKFIMVNPESYALASALLGCNISQDIRKFKERYEQYFFR